MMEPRDTHPNVARDIINSKRLVKFFLEALDRPANVGSITAQRRNIAKTITLLSEQEPVDDFPRDQRGEKRRFGRRFHKPDEPYYSVEQAGLQRADVDGPHIIDIVL